MKLLSITICAVLSIGSGVTVSSLLYKNDEHAHEHQEIKENQVVAQAIYPEYTLEGLVNTADIVIYGKVKSKEKPKKKDFKIGSGEQAEVVEEVKTGVQIQVKESIKMNKI